MPVVIDGNNLLHSLPRDQRSRASVRHAALELVRNEGVRITVVFDGSPPPGTPEVEHLGRVCVRYSGPTTADDVILGLLPPRGSASEWIVVTDDRELRERVRERGAALRKLSEWSARKARAPRHPVREAKLSPHEIEDWEDYFSSARDADDSQS